MSRPVWPHRTRWCRPKFSHSRAYTSERKVWRCTAGCFLGFMIGWRISLKLKEHVTEQQQAEEV